MLADTEHLSEQIQRIGSVRVLKRAHRAQRKAAQKGRRSQAWREVRCFWTWPLTHEWGPEDEDRKKRCVGCGKPQ